MILTGRMFQSNGSVQERFGRLDVFDALQGNEFGRSVATFKAAEATSATEFGIHEAGSILLDRCVMGIPRRDAYHPEQLKLIEEEFAVKMSQLQITNSEESTPPPPS